MTLREEVHERIDQLDDASLPKLMEQLEILEQDTGSKEFSDALNNAHERNKDLSGEDALKIATEAVKAHRQKNRH